MFNTDPPGVIILNVKGGRRCDVFMEPGGIFEISVLDVQPSETQTVRKKRRGRRRRSRRGRRREKPRNLRKREKKKK